MTIPPAGRIILVRHGETEANRRRCFADSDEIPLTDLGVRQAHELAALLAREFRADVVLTSEFRRARQTGEVIASVIGATAEAIPGIQERDFGCLRGHPYERFAELKALDAASASPGWAPAGGESMDAVRLRASEAMEALRARYPGREVVVVCHGGVIQALCAHITGEWRDAWVPPNCGIVTIAWDERGWGTPLVSGAWEMLVEPA